MSTVLEREIKEIARILAGIERHAHENDPALDKQLDMVQEIFTDFNKKYPLVSFKIEKSIDHIELKILISAESVKSVFDATASKIKGFNAIGARSFNEASVQQSEEFNRIIASLSDAAYLTYTTDSGRETLVLLWNEQEKKVELNYEIKSLANPLAPQFQLLQTYAQKQAGDQIDLLSKCYQLGFTDIEDAALFEWEDEFYPKMLE